MIKKRKIRRRGVVAFAVCIQGYAVAKTRAFAVGRGKGGREGERILITDLMERHHRVRRCCYRAI